MAHRVARSVFIAISVIMSLLLISDCSRSREQSTAEDNSVVVPQGDQTLIIFNWENYIGKDTVKNFEKETGIEVVEVFFPNEEEMLGAVQSGLGDYDLVVASDDAVREMRQAKMLFELDYTKIPNFQYIDLKFLNRAWDPEQKFSVPYLWGTLGIVVNTKYVPETDDSWGILFDVTYDGRIAMLDDPWEAMVAASKYLGNSINTSDESELADLSAKLLEQKPIVEGYVDAETMHDWLVEEKVWIGIYYNGDALYAGEINENLRYFVPKEGSVQYVDLFIIPKKAKHVEAAHMFLDFILRPEVAAAIASEYWYATPNSAAEKLMDPEVLSSAVVYPSEEILSRCEFFETGGEADRAISKTWATLMVED